MKTCPFCSKEIADQEAVCPYCGSDLVAAAADAAAQLKSVGYPLINSILWIAGYVLLATLIRTLALYFGARSLGYWSVILAGVVSLAVLGYGVYRAHQQKRSAIKWFLIAYSGWTVLWTAFMTAVALGLE